MRRRIPLVFAASFLSFVIPAALSADQAPAESAPAATALRISTADLRPMLAAQAQGGGRGGGTQGGGTQGGGTQGGGTQGGGTQGGQGQGQGQKPTQPPRAEDDMLFPEFDALLEIGKRCKGMKGKLSIPAGMSGGKKPNVSPIPLLRQTDQDSNSGSYLGVIEVARCSSYTDVLLAGGYQIQLQPLTNGMVPYVGGTVGLARSFGSSALAIQPEGGIKIPFEPFAIRVYADYRVAFYEGASEGAFGVGGGIIIPIKR